MDKHEPKVQYCAMNKIESHALHMLAAHAGTNTPERANNTYVTDLFDEFANSFDEILKGLQYRAPRLVGEKANHWHKGKPARILDAGCGIGLCAEHLKRLAIELIGIYLSTAMLQRARALNLYDQLIQTEIVDYLGTTTDPFDMTSSADTLCYFREFKLFF